MNKRHPQLFRRVPAAFGSVFVGWARRKSAFAHPTLRRARRGIQEEVIMSKRIKGGV
jgi:hypothetical protein